MHHYTTETRAHTRISDTATIYLGHAPLHTNARAHTRTHTWIQNTFKHKHMLTHTQILPPSIGDLEQLHTFHVQNTPYLERFPLEFGKLKHVSSGGNLKEVKYDVDDVVYPPVEVSDQVCRHIVLGTRISPSCFSFTGDGSGLPPSILGFGVCICLCMRVCI